MFEFCSFVFLCLSSYHHVIFSFHLVPLVIFCSDGKVDLQLLQFQWKSSISPFSMHSYSLCDTWAQFKQNCNLQPEQTTCSSTCLSHFWHLLMKQLSSISDILCLLGLLFWLVLLSLMLKSLLPPEAILSQSSPTTDGTWLGNNCIDVSQLVYIQIPVAESISTQQM